MGNELKKNLFGWLFLITILSSGVVQAQWKKPKKTSDTNKKPISGWQKRVASLEGTNDSSSRYYTYLDPSLDNYILVLHPKLASIVHAYHNEYIEEENAIEFQRISPTEFAISDYKIEYSKLIKHSSFNITKVQPKHSGVSITIQGGNRLIAKKDNPYAPNGREILVKYQMNYLADGSITLEALKGHRYEAANYSSEHHLIVTHMDAFHTGQMIKSDGWNETDDYPLIQANQDLFNWFKDQNYQITTVTHPNYPSILQKKDNIYGKDLINIDGNFRNLVAGESDYVSYQGLLAGKTYTVSGLFINQCHYRMVRSVMTALHAKGSYAETIHIPLPAVGHSDIFGKDLEISKDQERTYFEWSGNVVKDELLRENGLSYFTALCDIVGKKASTVNKYDCDQAEKKNQIQYYIDNRRVKIEGEGQKVTKVYFWTSMRSYFDAVQGD